MFQDFITHAGTGRYNLICYLVAHDKKLPAYEDDKISIGDSLIPKHVKLEALEQLGATINFIDVWIRVLEDNYNARRASYITAMKDMFKKIPLNMIKPLTPKPKVQKLMTDIGGEWFIEKVLSYYHKEIKNKYKITSEGG